MRSRRLVLNKNEPLRLLEMFADASGWEFVGAMDRDADRLINHERKWRVDAATSVHYVVDDTGVDTTGQLRYLVVLGEDPVRLDRVVGVVEDGGVNVWAVPDLVEIADLSFGSDLPEEQVRAILRLGLGAPLAVTDEIRGLFARAAGDKTPIVRYAALHAMVHAEWPECRELAAGLVQDPRPEVAQLAGMVVEAFATA